VLVLLKSENSLLSLKHKSVQGRITLHSALTFAPLRVFGQVETFPVKQIILYEDAGMVLWTVGSRVSCWHTGNLQDSKGKGKGKVKTKGRTTPKNVSKWIERAELRADLAESAKLMEDERRENIRAQERLVTQERALDDLGLNESEAVEYAIMLSRESALTEMEGVFAFDDLETAVSRLESLSIAGAGPVGNDDNRGTRSQGEAGEVGDASEGSEVNEGKCKGDGNGGTEDDFTIQSNSAGTDFETTRPDMRGLTYTHSQDNKAKTGPGSSSPLGMHGHTRSGGNYTSDEGCLNPVDSSLREDFPTLSSSFGSMNQSRLLSKSQPQSFVSTPTETHLLSGSHSHSPPRLPSGSHSQSPSPSPPTTTMANRARMSALGSSGAKPNSSIVPSLSIISHQSNDFSSGGGLEDESDMDADMRYAIQLSLAEAESKRGTS